MDFPLILFPSSIKRLDSFDISYKADCLMSERFYQKKLKSNKKTIIHAPLRPRLDLSIIPNDEDINVLNIICLVLVWWIVLPFLFIKGLSFPYKYYQYLKSKKNYRELLLYEEVYIDYYDFIFIVNSEFQEYCKTAEIEIKNTIHEVKSAKLLEISKKIVKPINITTPRKRGISESFFVGRLKSYFDFLELEIITECMINYYYPDIVLLVNEELYIDIEIDEPYVGDTKEVIHYSDPEYYCDEDRNNSFLEANWIVIRFSEEQIVKNSFSCCYEIALVLAKIFDFDVPEDKTYKRLVPTNFWSKETAENLAISDYRNFYIPEKIKLRFAKLL